MRQCGLRKFCFLIFFMIDRETDRNLTDFSTRMHFQIKKQIYIFWLKMYYRRNSLFLLKNYD